MVGTARIMDSSTQVGSIRFLPAPDELEAKRTASGFRVQVPVEITLRHPDERRQMMLSNLRATFFTKGEAGEQIEVGEASDASFHYGPAEDASRRLSWLWTLPAYVFYERLRAGEEPGFHVAVAGELCYLMPSGPPGMLIRSAPVPFYDHVELRYSREVWVKMLRQLNLRETILIEIPFPTTPPSGWEGVWQALIRARDAFDQGGETGWRACVANARIALEEWNKQEREDPGPEDPKSRSEGQRRDRLRQDLRLYAHRAVHAAAGSDDRWDRWSREDALLVLSTLCAILAVRSP